LSEEERARRRGLVEVASADVAVAVAAAATADAAVPVAEAALETVRTDLERSTVRAPLAARVLQVRIRPGEFVTAGPSPTPWLILGDTSTLHVRVDFDEHEAGRVRAGARATARIRGNATPAVPLEFVRFEPLVIPKQSLTGAMTERVDTRVLQVVYRVATTNLPLFVGQQMDVFVEAPEAAAP